MITSKLIKILPDGFRQKIQNNDDLKKILGNINWLTFENVLKSLVGLVIFAWVARYLGPDQFGTMNYVYAFVTLFSSVATLGLDNVVIREILNHEEKEKEYLGSTLLLKFAGAFLSIISALIAISVVNPGDTLLRILVMITSSMYIFKSFDVIDFWFQSKIQAKFAVSARTIAFVVITGLKILFIFSNAPLLMFVMMFALEALITAILLILFYVRHTRIRIFEWKVSKSIILKLLNDSWPLMLGGIASLIYMKIDQVMIGKMLTSADVGVYYSAVKLSETWYFVPTIIGASVFPAILNAKRKSEELYNKRLQMLFDFSAWAGIAISLVITIMAPLIIKVMYGLEYMAAAPVLSLHIWSGVFVFLGVIASKWVITENFTKNALIRTTIGAILNILLNLILIKPLGIMGAAVATLVSYSFVNYFSLFFSKKTRPCFIMQTKAFNIFRILRIKKLLKYVNKRIRYSYWALFYELRCKFSKKIGVRCNDSKERIIVTFTSYPKRYDVVHLTIASLLNQTKKPDKIILWIAEEERGLPKKVLDLQRNGLEVRYVKGNIRSYKKLVYAIQEFPELLLITVDDDTIYPRTFIEDLYEQHKKHSECIIANRCTYMNIEDGKVSPYLEWRENLLDNPSFKQFPTGVGGILYPPKSLHPQVLDEQIFMLICPSADDVWFKAMGLLNGTKTYYTGMNEERLLSIKKAQRSSLWRINVIENKNDEQIKDVFDKYNLYSILEK